MEKRQDLPPESKSFRQSAPRQYGTRFVYDGDVLAEEIPLVEDGALVLEARTLWHFEPDSFRPIAKQTADGKLGYIVTDHLGTPREMLDENGEAAWRATHHLWGNVRQSWVKSKTFVAGNTALKEAETDLCPFRFQGQWADEESGLFYNRYRHYDPLAGSYISSDPIGLAGGSRPHGHVANPNGWVDPSGLTAAKGLGDSNTSPWLADPRAGVVSHLETFRDGGSFLVPKSAYEKFMKGQIVIGRRDGQFITTSKYMDKLIKQSKGDLDFIKKKLGIPPEYWNEELMRIDVQNPLLYNGRFPSGLESGANEMFKWGGYTSGGMPEIVIDPIPSSGYTVTPTGIKP